MSRKARSTIVKALSKTLSRPLETRIERSTIKIGRATLEKPGAKHEKLPVGAEMPLA